MAFNTAPAVPASQKKKIKKPKCLVRINTSRTRLKTCGRRTQVTSDSIALCSANVDNQNLFTEKFRTMRKHVKLKGC